MATEVKKSVTSYTAQRVILTSAKPLKETLSLLDEELNREKAGLGVLFKVLGEVKTKEDVERSIGSLTEGKRDFMYADLVISLCLDLCADSMDEFHSFFAISSHTNWMNVYFEGSKKLAESYTVTVGNPLIAKNFVQYDTRAGLYVPPRVLVEETAEGGTLVMYDLPSSVMVVDPDSPEEMKQALRELDEKLDGFFTRVLGTSSKARF